MLTSRALCGSVRMGSTKVLYNAATAHTDIGQTFPSNHWKESRHPPDSYSPQQIGAPYQILHSVALARAERFSTKYTAS